MTRDVWSQTNELNVSLSFTDTNSQNNVQVSEMANVYAGVFPSTTIPSLNQVQNGGYSTSCATNSCTLNVEQTLTDGNHSLVRSQRQGRKRAWSEQTERSFPRGHGRAVLHDAVFCSQHHQSDLDESSLARLSGFQQWPGWLCPQCNSRPQRARSPPTTSAQPRVKTSPV